MGAYAEIIGFTGHRDGLCERAELDRLAADYPGALWVHGGADGFDTQVELYAREHGIETRILRPDFKRWGRYEAPHVRNRQIVDLAFIMVTLYDGRKTGGTYRTLLYAQAQAKGIRELAFDLRLCI